MSDAGPGEGQQVKAQEGCSGHDALDYERARDRVQELKGFYAHAAVFLFANIVLVVLNLATLRKNDGVLWFVWPLVGWGLVLAIHAVSVFGIGRFLGREWEQRRIQQELDRRRGGQR